ncbi:hypothetical protein Cpir12675_005801 [Ceratocystis pirilliformis]|uniref:Uncharacterized protein n=1 Tax=Ceratocystis pirilliformis TaxID=259994 RepID=A0ABR3YM14_9PEZI
MSGLPQVPVPLNQLIQNITNHPNTSISAILAPYRAYENELRKLFAQAPGHVVFQNPYVNVIPLFPHSAAPCTTQARDLASESPDEKSRYIMALPPHLRRPHGSPATVANLAGFCKNFAAFSEQSMASQHGLTSKKKLREYYHERFCPASDINLLLYDLTPEQALSKIAQIEQTVREAVLPKVTVVRTNYAMTLASQSVNEILTGFDIDASGAAYDGSQVYVTPRALGSFITQINHIDTSRRSPSYEYRLSKYSHRNAEIYCTGLDRSRVDPTIYERSFRQVVGLASLLVLEQLPTVSARSE